MEGGRGENEGGDDEMRRDIRKNMKRWGGRREMRMT